MTVIDYNGDDHTGDGNTWQFNEWGPNAQYRYSSNNAADDWLLTPQLTLKKGVEYTFTFQAKVSSPAFPEAFSVHIGQGSDLSTYATIHSRKQLDSNAYQEQSVKTTVAADGKYRFAIRCVSDANMANFIVNNLVVTEGITTASPATVANLKVTPAEEGALSATISFNAPDKTAQGDDLTSLTKIEVYRGETLIKTFENPAVGSLCEFVDNSPANGFNTYKVIASNVDGAGNDVQATAFIGQDVPLAPTNLTIKDNGDGTAKLTWTAVGNKGANDGYVNTAAVTYKVYLEENETTATVVAQDITATECTITLPASSEQDIYFYRVTASVSGVGEGEYALVSIVAGDPYTLPYEESFAGGQASHYAVGTKTGTNGFSPTSWLSSDDDGGSMLATGVQTGEEITLSLGKISLKNNANPVLTFKYYVIPGKNAKLYVDIKKPNGINLTVETIDIATMSGSAGWFEKSVKLADYNALDYVTLTFRAVANQANCSFGIDAVSIRNVVSKDMNVKVSAPATVKAGASAVITATVENTGADTADSYTIDLYVNDAKVKTFNGTTLVFNETKSFEYTYSSKVTDPETFEIYAVVNYAGDENENDNTSAKVTMNLVQPTLPAISDLTGQQTSDGVALSWTGINTPSETVTDDFEGYADFTITDFGAWTAYDGDGYNTWKPTSYGNFTNAGEKMAYIIYNPSALGMDLTDDSYSSYVPHSGNKFLACLAADTYFSGNNDYLISEMLSGNAQTVKLYARSYDSSGYYAETFEVRYSTTGNAPENFTTTVASKTCGTSWTEYTFDLPAGARYFAIVCTSANKLMLQIDDVTYEKGGLSAKSYNVYRDNKLIASLPAGTTTFTDDEATVGDHNYNVTAVYDDGESSLSNTFAITVATAINSVSVNGTANSATHYDINGRMVAPATKGMHIVRQSDGKVRKVMVK